MRCVRITARSINSSFGIASSALRLAAYARSEYFAGETLSAVLRGALSGLLIVIAATAAAPLLSSVVP